MRTRGYIDGIFGAAVRGWVVDLDQPDVPVEVVVRIDGQEFAPVVADEPREDLARAGIGNGLGGFRVQIGAEPTPGPHEIVALVAGTLDTVPLASDVRLTHADQSPRLDLELYEAHAPAPAQPPVLPLPDEDGAEDPPALPRPVGTPGEAALAGEGGWLFDCPAQGFARLRGTEAPDPAALGELTERLAAFGAAARARGTRTLVAVLPDKLHVYPEQAPSSMPLSAAGRVAAGLALELEDLDDLLLIDLLPVLLRGRAHGWVHTRAGLGPSWLGAFLAYRNLARLLALRYDVMRPQSVDAFTAGQPVAVTDAPGEVPLLRWNGSGLTADGDAAALSATASEPDLVRFGHAVSEGAPSALILHDQRTRRVAELLAGDCVRATLLAEAPDPTLVTAGEAPDLALWLVGDRTLAELTGTAQPAESASVS